MAENVRALKRVQGVVVIPREHDLLLLVVVVGQRCAPLQH